MALHDDRHAGTRIVVIGPCAAGKSTLVDGLRALGYDAYVCGQEHSEIPTLWRHGEPDYLIVLDVDLDTIRERRGNEWPAALYATQIDRLRLAREVADVVIDASQLSVAHVLDAAVGALQRRSGKERILT